MAEIIKINDPLTEQDVFDTCDTLQMRGEGVSRRAVYKALGRGSMTTISRLVSLWEDKQAAQVEARDIDLTAEDSEAILTFGRQMLRSLTDRMRQQAAEDTARLTHLADEERRRAIDIAQAYDELVSETKDKVTQIETRSEQAAEELRTKNEKLKDELAKTRDQMKSLEDQIAEERRKSAEAQGRASVLEQDRERIASLESQLSSFVSILQKRDPQ
jgi:chromosome segregation ATPase